MLTLAQLIAPISEDDALTSMLGILSQLGFQATSWQDGSIQLTMLRLFARQYVKLTAIVAQIAAGGYTTLAVSGFLTLLARYVYNIERDEAESTVGTITLTSSAAANTNTWIAGDIIIADQPQGVTGANSYTITVGGTLAPGSSGTYEFKADVPGSAANIAPNATLYLWTPLVGVTATNPANLPTSNTWITTPGQDEEQDSRLAQRCITQWTTLSYGNVDGAYIYWALQALPAVTRSQVASSPGTGLVTLYLATAAGPITGPQATTIANYINGVIDGVGRRPINDVLSVQPTATLTTPALAITAYVESRVLATAQADIVAAVLAYLGTVPVGGVKLVGTQGLVLLDDIIEAAKLNDDMDGPRDGVRSIHIPLSDNIPIADGQIYLPTVTVTLIAVAPGQ